MTQNAEVPVNIKDIPCFSGHAQHACEKPGSVVGYKISNFIFLRKCLMFDKGPIQTWSFTWITLSRSLYKQNTWVAASILKLSGEEKNCNKNSSKTCNLLLNASFTWDCICWVQIKVCPREVEAEQDAQCGAKLYLTQKLKRKQSKNLITVHIF